MSEQHYIKPNTTPSCIPPQALSVVLAYVFKQWSEERAAGIVRTSPRSANYLINYYKLFRLKNRLVKCAATQSAQAKANSQYASKPKNPV